MFDILSTFRLLNVHLVCDSAMIQQKTQINGKRILLTGGSGFLGRAIIAEILNETSPLYTKELTVFDLKPPEGIAEDRVIYVKGDVRDAKRLKEVCRGMDAVIHSAAVVDWGNRTETEIMEVNFGGTKNVIEACRFNGVKALLYTSSLDVLFDGRELVDVDEDTPYPELHSSYYCTTKYLAEKMVLESNCDILKTCALRPADIYGGGDPFHIGSLIGMAKGGFYVRLGDGEAKSQHVYVGNIAYAHVMAVKALLEDKSKVAGNPYFITDGPGSNFFNFFDNIVLETGCRIWPRNLWLPRRFAYVIGSVSEFIALILRPIIKYTPKMSRFAVLYTCTNFTFSSDRAKSDFGFVPKYNMEEAMERTVEYYRKAVP